MQADISIKNTARFKGQSGPFQSSSDILDMKLLLERLTDTAELEHYMRSAQIAVTGTPPEKE
jgi:hypothetical protein